MALIKMFDRYKDLKRIENKYNNKRVFIVGSGPSVNLIDLNVLLENKEMVMTVNLSHRFFEGKVPFHCVSDIDCFLEYKNEILSDRFDCIFIRDHVYKALDNSDKSEKIVSIPTKRGGIIKKGVSKNLYQGLGNDSSVILFGIQILVHMGFKEIYIIGCDLDYSGSKYGYAMSNQDILHEEKEVTQRKRRKSNVTNEEFKILQKALNVKRVKLFNAGVGGNLNSIQRVDFSSLF